MFRLEIFYNELIERVNLASIKLEESELKKVSYK